MKIIRCSILLLVVAFALYSHSSFAVVPEDLQDLRWRLAGPLRAGWSTCAEGLPDEPNTFYFGGADGGIWKTIDAGVTWSPIADRAAFSSVGALAIAQTKPPTIYVGSGQVDARYDIMNGNGVYKSEDDGKTWIALGLSDSQHIGRILIDPRDPKVLLVAALGHVFGTNTERGVFRSEDGGQHWTKVLFIDENTGAVDLASDPASPDIVYAATWQLRRYPFLDYFLPAGGPGSGIWKSTDGGKTWTRTSQKGLPDGPLGRVGLAVGANTNGQRIYASVSAKVKGGLYRSDDGGSTWQYVNEDTALASSYFGRITSDPHNADVLYVMGQSIKRSADGGKTFTIIKGAPGGDDYHFYWINPKHPEQSIVASDQGTAVTINGGKTWSPWYNQATGQFYYLSTDNRFPYWIYSGQQDSGTAAVASRSDYGQLTFREWHPVGGDERDYDIPDPEDPNIVYGSGLGGRLSKWDARTGRVSNISPTPITNYGVRPTTIKYRYTWFTPIAVSKRKPYALYQGAQYLFRSLDKGQTWEIISPDLTGTEPGRKDCLGDVPIERTTACGYGVIYTINPSTTAEGTIWVGTDNGRIWLTRDNAKHWTNITPAGLKDWSKVASIDPSSTDPATAYAAVDRHRMDDRQPYVYRTHDYGKTWTAIASGLPAEAWVNVVRQDPQKAGLLYAGTRTGVYVSFDDGDHWQPLQLNLPTSSVNDLIVHDRDIVVATEGRAIWILDDVTPLRALHERNAEQPLLVPPAPAFRVSNNENRDTPLPPEMPAAENPPTGAIIDYFLPSGIAEATLEILDAKGSVIRTFSSADKPQRPEAERYFSEFWLQPLPVLPIRPGHNRFVWNLRYERPAAAEYQFSIAAIPGEDTPAIPAGMLVQPGRYTVRFTVKNGKAFTQPLEVRLDPRSKSSIQDLSAQYALYREASEALKKASKTVKDAKEEQKKLKNAVSSDAKEKGEQLGKMLDTTDKNSPASVEEDLRSLVADLESSDGPPTSAQRATLQELKDKTARMQ
jgi:photosystem II stability/assembly factor-like uncharacterized protein